MLFEMRTYRVKPGSANEFLSIYEREGLGIITRYARLIGCWQTESGTLNSIVYIWGYDDHGHRSQQRGKLAQDKEWQAFVPKILPYLLNQESAFLLPAGFSPIR